MGLWCDFLGDRCASARVEPCPPGVVTLLSSFHEFVPEGSFDVDVAENGGSESSGFFCVVVLEFLREGFSCGGGCYDDVGVGGFRDRIKKSDLIDVAEVPGEGPVVAVGLNDVDSH